MKEAVRMVKKYRFGLSTHGLALFFIIMLPNFVWFAAPAPRDILRNVSLTPALDRAGSVCQIGMTAALAFIIRIDAAAFSFQSKWIRAATLCTAAYFAAWLLYYCGIVTGLLMMGLCIFPCMAFLCYEIDRMNGPALILTGIFTVLHAVYGAVNFIL